MQTVFRPYALSQPGARQQGLPVGFVTLYLKQLRVKAGSPFTKRRFSYIIVHVHNSFQINDIFFSAIRPSFSLTESNNHYCVNLFKQDYNFINKFVT